MKPVFQTKFGGADAPEEDQGNCMAACLASIFEVGLDGVPDFIGQIESGKWWFTLSEWLKARNLAILMIKTPAFDVPAGFAMAGVDSETLLDDRGGKDGHMVVVNGGQLAHDPNPNAKRGPDDYQVKEYWAFTCVDSSKQGTR